MTNRRAIHSAATREAKTFTHRDSTMSRRAMATPSTNQSSTNHVTGVATPRPTVNGCSSFWNVKRDLSTGGGWGAAFGSGVGVVSGTQTLPPARKWGAPDYTLWHHTTLK